MGKEADMHLILTHIADQSGGILFKSGILKF